MEQKETKTITMPYSEYQKLTDELQMLRTKHGIQYLKEYEDKYILEKQDNFYLKDVLKDREDYITTLKQELSKYESKKWWQFWKC